MRISDWSSDVCSSDLRATTVENDPSAYLAGESMGGSSGSCVPLPPGSGSEGYYEATCNSGTKVEDRPETCTIRMVPEVQTVDRYKYYVVPDSARSEEHTSELQSLMRISYAVFC